MDVFENSGTPKSSHFNRVFHYFHHPFWGFPPIFGSTPICLQMGLVQPTTNYIVKDQRPPPRRGGLIAVRMPSSRLSDAARPLQALPTSNDLRADRLEKKHPMTDASMGRWYVYLPIHEWWISW